MNFQRRTLLFVAFLFWTDDILAMMISQTGDRIVAGRPASQGEIPHQLSLHRKGRHICGASLVQLQGVQFGMTAAHCVSRRRLQDFVAIAGELDLADSTGNEQRSELKEIVVHPNYTLSGWKIANDLAILFFSQEFKENENVKTIALPPKGQETVGSLTVSGWGRVRGGGRFPNMLQVVELPVVPRKECGNKWSDHIQPLEIGEGILCAGIPTGKQYPCHGDSGGPATSKEGYLAGVVSFVDPLCKRTFFPAGFTKVSKYIDWISGVIRQHEKL